MDDFNAFVILLSAAGAIIMVLLGVVSFFLKPLLRAIDGLKEAVNDLKLLVELQKQEAKSFNKLCDWKHDLIEKRLDEIENKE
jgi:F0F1-type ATP synthase membrane subunit b/b'